MPLPYPKPNENEDQFISRCMADERMVTEFPDEAQRFAVCKRQVEVNDKIVKKSKKDGKE